MTRAQLKSLVRTLLATPADDPAFSDAVLEPMLQMAVNGITADILLANPSYLQTTVTLAADSSTVWTYSFATQAVPITDFGSWLEVRETDQDGDPLMECRIEELADNGTGYFAITGPDQSPVLTRNSNDLAGQALFFRYSQQPADFASDSDVPTWVPLKFHDVIALECLFVYGLGGEARRPAELTQRWMDRKAQMLARVGRRGIQPSQTRVLSDHI